MKVKTKIKIQIPVVKISKIIRQKTTKSQELKKFSFVNLLMNAAYQLFFLKNRLVQKVQKI